MTYMISANLVGKDLTTTTYHVSSDLRGFAGMFRVSPVGWVENEAEPQRKRKGSKREPLDLRESPSLMDPLPRLPGAKRAVMCCYQ